MKHNDAKFEALDLVWAHYFLSFGTNFVRRGKKTTSFLWLGKAKRDDWFMIVRIKRSPSWGLVICKGRWGVYFSEKLMLFFFFSFNFQQNVRNTLCSLKLDWTDRFQLKSRMPRRQEVDNSTNSLGTVATTKKWSGKWICRLGLKM